MESSSWPHHRRSHLAGRPDVLEAGGIRPTLTAVRNEVGGGSFTTITNAMGEWRKRRQQEALAPMEPLPDEIGQHVDVISGAHRVRLSQVEG